MLKMKTKIKKEDPLNQAIIYTINNTVFPSSLKVVLPLDKEGKVNKMNDIPDKYKEIHEFFAASPTRREKYLHFKYMIEHYILSFWYKVKSWFK